MVEHALGKGEIESSIPSTGSISTQLFGALLTLRATLREKWLWCWIPYEKVCVFRAGVGTLLVSRRKIRSAFVRLLKAVLFLDFRKLESVSCWEFGFEIGLEF